MGTNLDKNCEILHLQYKICSLSGNMPKDFLYYIGFRIGIFLYLFPLLGSKPFFRVSIQPTAFFVRSQPVAESYHSFRFFATKGEYMQVHFRLLAFEHPMCKALRFPYSQNISAVLQGDNVTSSSAESSTRRRISTMVLRLAEHFFHDSLWMPYSMRV